MLLFPSRALVFIKTTIILLMLNGAAYFHNDAIQHKPRGDMITQSCTTAQAIKMTKQSTTQKKHVDVSFLRTSNTFGPQFLSLE